MAFSDAVACLQSIDVAVKSISLAGAESGTHRECVIEDCVSQIRALVAQANGLTMEIRESTFEFGHHTVEAFPDLLDLSARCRRGGLLGIHVRPTANDRHLRNVLQVIGGNESGWTDLEETIPIATRISRLGLRGITVSGEAITHRSSGLWARVDSGDKPVWANGWKEEIQAEEARVLEHEVGQRVLLDLRAVPFGTPYRTRAIQTLGGLLARLVEQDRLSAAVTLWDAIEAAGARSDRPLQPGELDAIHATLEPFRSEAFVRKLVRRGRPAPDDAVAAFVVRLGGKTIERLLRDSTVPTAPERNSLLTTLARHDRAPFVRMFAQEDDCLRERALVVLLEADQIVSAELLEDLAAATGALRTRALDALMHQHPERLPAQKLLGLLDDPELAVRLLVLRRLLESRPADAYPTLESWFRARQRSLSFSERKLVLACLGATGGEQGLALLAELIEPRGLFRRNGGESDDRLCAVHALEHVALAAADDLLEQLADSKDDHVRDAARVVRRARER